MRGKSDKESTANTSNTQTNIIQSINRFAREYETSELCSLGHKLLHELSFKN